MQPSWGWRHFAGGSIGSQCLADRRRSRNGTFFGEGLVVLLDLLEGIEVVHHQPLRLLQALGRDIAEEVQALEASPVAEMEPGDRIERPPLPVLRIEEVRCRSRQQRRPNLFTPGWIRMPAGRLKQGQDILHCGAEACVLALLRALEPAGE